MTARPPRRRLPQAALLAALAALGLAAACVVPSPNQVAGPANAPEPVARAAGPTAAAAPRQPADTYFEFQVEQPVVALNAAAPVYPAELRAAGVGGQVIAQFVVDTTGAVETATFKVIEASHEALAAAVRDVLPQMRFSPAEIGGRRVKQLVQQPFLFRTEGGGEARALPSRIVAGADSAGLPAGVRLRRAAPAGAPAPAGDTASLPRKQPGDGHFEFQVERPATALPGPAPVYPAALQAQGIGGQVIAQFVVGPDGRVDAGTFKVLRSDHELFTAAVRAVLPEMRFAPALVGGRPVRQLLQLPFAFDVGR